jgi:hypothetical protein
MTMVQRLLTAALAMLAAGAHAQSAPPAPDAPPAPPAPPAPQWSVGPIAGIPGLPGEEVLLFASSELGGHGVVKAAPYSATAVNETRQTLADGNRIVRSSSTKLYRDSQGRTRQEQGRGVVFINDVVAGKRVLLNTERKTARELPLRERHVHVTPPVPPAPPVPPVPGAALTPPAPPAQMSGEEARSWAESMRQWAREFSARMRTDAAVVERDVDVVVRQGDAPIVNERVEVIRLGDGGSAPLPPAIPMQIPPGPGTKTSLGSREFDGVRADGTKTTWTIPAGRIGNEKPIDIVSERWYSPELMLVVYSRHADPRSGERIYRLEGIKRGDPPAELFGVPADYELRTRGAARPERR